MLKNSLDSFSKACEQFFDLCFKRPLVTLGVSVLILLAAASQFHKVKFVLNFSEFNDPAIGSTITWQQMSQHFEHSSAVTVLFTPNQGSFQDNQINLIKHWAEQVQTLNSRVLLVNSPFEIKTATKSGSLLLYQNLIAKGENSASSLTLLNQTPWKKVFYDGKSLLIQVRFKEDETPGKYGGFDPRFLKDWQREVQDSFKGANLTVGFAGEATFLNALVEATKRYRILNLLMIGLILIFFRYFFGTWRAGILILITLVWTASLLFGLCGWLGYALDPLALTIFLITSVAVLQDFFFISTIRSQQTQNNHWLESFRSILIPAFFTTLTTLVGFWSLLSSPIAIIARFGFLCGLGALLEWTACFYILPSLIGVFSNVFPSLKSWTSSQKITWVSRLSESSPIKTKFTAFLIFGIIAGALVGFNFLNYKDSPLGLFDSHHPFRKTTTILGESRNLVGEFFLYFPDGAPSEISRAQELGAKLGQLPLISHIETPTSLLTYSSQNVPNHLVPMVVRDVSMSAQYKFFQSDSGASRYQVYLSSIELQKLVPFLDQINTLCAPYGCKPVGPLISYIEFARRVPDTLFKSLWISLALTFLIIYFLTIGTGVGKFWVIAIGSLSGLLAIIPVLSLWEISINFQTCIFAAVLVGVSGDCAIQFIFSTHRSAQGNLLVGIKNLGASALHLSLIISLLCLTFTFSLIASSRPVGVILGLGIILTACGDVFILKSLISSDKNLN